MRILWLDLNCSYAHSSLALPALHAQVMHRTDVEWEVVHTTTGEDRGYWFGYDTTTQRPTPTFRAEA